MLSDAVAQVHVHRVPLLPEIVLGELPAGTHVLIMTHDHAEDAALCDAVLRTGQFGSIGLIGSAGKWARFRAKLADEGHDATTIARIRTPIGLPEHRRQGAGHDRGERRRRAGERVRARHVAGGRRQRKPEVGT